MTEKQLYGDVSTCAPVEPASKKKNKLIYPSIYLDPKQLEKIGISEFKPGETFELTIVGKVREKTIRENQDGSKEIRQSIDILSAGEPSATEDPEEAGEVNEEENSEDDAEEKMLGYKRDKKPGSKISAKDALGD